MERRLQLQEELQKIPGVKGVYFQPPESVKMVYPAIRYNWNRNWRQSADNGPYMHKRNYSLIVIDYDPDSSIPDYLVDHFAHCSLDRWYADDNLNHWSLTLYY